MQTSSTSYPSDAWTQDFSTVISGGAIRIMLLLKIKIVNGLAVEYAAYREWSTECPWIRDL